MHPTSRVGPGFSPQYGQFLVVEPATGKVLDVCSSYDELQASQATYRDQLQLTIEVISTLTGTCYRVEPGGAEPQRDCPNCWTTLPQSAAVCTHCGKRC